MNKLYVSTTFATDGSRVSEILKKCYEHGVVNIELGSNHAYEDDFINLLSKYNFNYLVHNYFPVPKESFIVNIASLDNNIFDRSLKHVKNSIDFCKEINAKLYTFHPGFLVDPKDTNLDSSNYDFQFEEIKYSKELYNKAINRMYRALEEIVDYANLRNVSIAIETEGSVSKKDKLLMQKPEEYETFKSKFTPEQIGINLNIGHLNLASRAFNFKREDFVNLIQDYVVAMELSHNEGVNDDHLPLKEGEWYWKHINDKKFKKTFKIIETRETSITEILKVIDLFNKRKAIFMDRDGVINKLVPWLHKKEDFELLSDSAKAIKMINKSGYLAIVVTNQSIISRGISSEENLNGIHDKMRMLIGEQGARIDKIYYCPHHPEFTGACDCRKPNLGLIKKAKEEFNIDLSNSYMVGDSSSDIFCGKKAGLKTIGVRTGYSCQGSIPDKMFDDLYQAIRFILDI